MGFRGSVKPQWPAMGPGGLGFEGPQEWGYRLKSPALSETQASGFMEQREE